MRFEHLDDLFSEFGVVNVIGINGNSPGGGGVFRWFGLSGLWSIGVVGLLVSVERQLQHRFEFQAGLIGECVCGEWVSFGVRSYGAFREVFPGFREVGNRTSESFVGFDVGNSVRGPYVVSLWDRGFRFEVHEARRGGHDFCGLRGHRSYRDAFHKQDRVGLV